MKFNHIIDRNSYIYRDYDGMSHLRDKLLDDHAVDLYNNTATKFASGIDETIFIFIREIIYEFKFESI